MSQMSEPSIINKLLITTVSLLTLVGFVWGLCCTEAEWFDKSEIKPIITFAFVILIAISLIILYIKFWMWI